MTTRRRGSAAGSVALLLAATALGLALGEALARRYLRVRNVGPSFSRYDPELGKVHKASLRTVRHTPEFTMTFSTNARGFRGPEPAGDACGPVVLFVGDSFTEGYGVSDGEEFPALVREALAGDPAVRGTEVLNAGIGDTGTGRALRFLERWVPDPGRPVLVVYQVAPNDFEDNLAEGFYEVGAAGALAERRDAVPPSWFRTAQPVLESLPGVSQSYLVAAMLQAARGAGHPQALAANGRRTHAEERLTYRLLRALFRHTKDAGWRTVVVFWGLPGARGRLIDELSRRYDVHPVRLPAKSERPDLYYAVDGHWNRAGHAHVSAELLPVVRENVLAMRPAGTTACERGS